MEACQFQLQRVKREEKRNTTGGEEIDREAGYKEHGMFLVEWIFSA